MGCLVEEFSGEGAFTYTRAISLGNSYHVFYPFRCYARALRDACRGGAGGSDVGICAMVDAEHHALSALEEDLRVAVDRVVDEEAGVADAGSEHLGYLHILVVDLLIVERFETVHLQLHVLHLKSGLQALCEIFRIEKVAHTEAET